MTCEGVEQQSAMTGTPSIQPCIRWRGSTLDPPSVGP
jgi:hypothetical protein